MDRIGLGKKTAHDIEHGINIGETHPIRLILGSKVLEKFRRDHLPSFRKVLHPDGICPQFRVAPKCYQKEKDGTVTTVVAGLDVRQASCLKFGREHLYYGLEIPIKKQVRDKETLVIREKETTFMVKDKRDDTLV